MYGYIWLYWLHCIPYQLKVTACMRSAKKYGSMTFGRFYSSMYPCRRMHACKIEGNGVNCTTLYSSAHGRTVKLLAVHHPLLQIMLQQRESNCVQVTIDFDIRKWNEVWGYVWTEGLLRCVKIMENNLIFNGISILWKSFFILKPVTCLNVLRFRTRKFLT